MADPNLLPSMLAADARARAVFGLTDRIDALDLSPLLVYRVDSVPASALYALAWQFGVTGLAGWDMASTEDQRRDLVRRAIGLHRRKGTPWAIREALRAVGFLAVKILEGNGDPVADGTYLADGTITASPGAAWAEVVIRLGPPADGKPITPARRELLRGIVSTWKNARTRLAEMHYEVYVADGSYIADGTASAEGAPTII